MKMVFLPSICEQLRTASAWSAIGIIYYMACVLLISLLISLLIVISHESPEMIERRQKMKRHKLEEEKKREERCMNAIPASDTLKPDFKLAVSPLVKLLPVASPR